jgi:hypothetical protein
VEGNREAPAEGGALVFRFGDGGEAARVPLEGPDEGTLAWDGAPGGGAAGERDRGSYTRGGGAIAVRIPLALVRMDAGGAAGVAWRLEVERGGKVEERAPREGSFRTPPEPGDAPRSAPA